MRKKWFFLILILSFFLRVLSSYFVSLQFDEAATWFISTNTSFLGLLQGNYIYDPQPPAYYVLTKLFSVLFGEEIFSLRFISILLGVGSVYIAYRLIKLVSRSETTALVSSLLVATSPILIWFSMELRMYSLVFFSGVVALYCYFLFVKSKKMYIAFIMSIFAFIALFSSFSGIYVYVVIGLFVITDFLRENIKLVVAVNIISLLIISSVCGLFWYLAFLSKPDIQLALELTTWIPIPTHNDVIQVVLDLISFRWQKYSQFLPIGRFALLQLFLFVLYVAYYIELICKTKKKEEMDSLLYGAIILFAPIITSLFISFFFKPVFISRQVLISSLGYILIQSVIVNNFLSKKLFVVVGILFMLQTALFFISYLHNITTPIDTRLMPIESFKNNEKLSIAVTNPVSSYLIKYYLAKSDNQVFVKELALNQDQAELKINELKESSNDICLITYEHFSDSSLRVVLEHNLEKDYAHYYSNKVIVEEDQELVKTLPEIITNCYSKN